MNQPPTENDLAEHERAILAKLGEIYFAQVVADQWSDDTSIICELNPDTPEIDSAGRARMIHFARANGWILNWHPAGRMLAARRIGVHAASGEIN